MRGRLGGLVGPPQSKLSGGRNAGQDNRASEPQQATRSTHADMDRTVLNACGWPDVPTTCEFLLELDRESP